MSRLELWWRSGLKRGPFLFQYQKRRRSRSPDATRRVPPASGASPGGFRQHWRPPPAKQAWTELGSAGRPPDGLRAERRSPQGVTCRFYFYRPSFAEQICTPGSPAGKRTVTTEGLQPWWAEDLAQGES